MFAAAKVAWAAFKASRLFQWGALVAAGLGVFLIALARAESRGAEKAENAMREADSDRAREIEDDADETRRRLDAMSDDDVDEWLRNHPGRRD